MVYPLAALEDDHEARESAAEVAHKVKPKQSRAVKTSLGHGETVLAVQCGGGRGGGSCAGDSQVLPVRPEHH